MLNFLENLPKFFPTLSLNSLYEIEVSLWDILKTIRQSLKDHGTQNITTHNSEIANTLQVVNDLLNVLQEQINERTEELANEYYQERKELEEDELYKYKLQMRHGMIPDSEPKSIVEPEYIELIDSLGVSLQKLADFAQEYCDDVNSTGTPYDVWNFYEDELKDLFKETMRIRREIIPFSESHEIDEKMQKRKT